MDFSDNLTRYIKAGYNGLSVETTEEIRLMDECRRVAGRFEGLRILVWSRTRGLCENRNGDLVAINADAIESDVFYAIQDSGSDSLILMRDFQHYWDDPVVIRAARDALTWAKQHRTTILFIGARSNIPPDLAADIHEIEFALPSKDALRDLLDVLIDVNKKKINNETRQAAIDAASGLTTIEAENVFSLALGNGGLDPLVISKEKAAVIKRSGSLELYESNDIMDDVGGLTCLKEWLRKREQAFTPKAKEFGLPAPRGIILVGVPGSGKSLAAKAIAAAWNKPLLRFDVGAVFGSLVGESEQGMRRAIKTAEAAAPCILWIDEIDKAFSGASASGSLDSGVTARVFGTFLTWMQEKTSSVFVIATANNISALPPEMLRKGRFDECWFVDLPDENERKEIFKIHLRKRNRDMTDKDIEKLVSISNGFSGSEIEEAIISGLYAAFSDKARKLKPDDIADALTDTVPLFITSAETINALRDWAKGHARFASKKTVAAETAGRVLR